MFSDDDLKDMLRYIDMYHTSTFPTRRGRAIEFLTSKMGAKFPGITRDRVTKFVTNLGPELSALSPEHFAMFHSDSTTPEEADDGKGHDDTLASYRVDARLSPARSPHTPHPYVVPPASRGSLTDRPGYGSSTGSTHMDYTGLRPYERAYSPPLCDRYDPTARPGFMTDRYRTRPYRSFLGERDAARPSSVVPKLPLWKIREQAQERGGTADFVDRAGRLSRDIEAYRRSSDNIDAYKRPSDNIEYLQREFDEIQDQRLRVSTEVKEIMRKYETELSDTSASRYEAMAPISPPSWMSREERDYYTSATNKEKSALIEKYETMMAEEQSDAQPLRFQILLSGIPESKKAEIFTRLDTPVSLLGDNAKYMAWVKSLIKVPFNNHTPLPPIAADSEAVNEYMASCSHSFNGEVYGHDKVKNEFLTMIGSWLTTGNSHQFGNVIGVTGPIGVGKTTLIKEGLSRAINRPFYFISLGGTSYSSFLQGHGYTYEGSTYGEIARGLIESKCMDPIFYFDELDKVASDGKGDEVIHALIHLTDPAQNDQFHDRYFAGIDLDVSKALFVFSYNDRDKVNPILRDRIHEIALNDFSVGEKTDIARKYVLPKISKGMSLELDTLVDFTEGSIEHLVGLCEDTTGMRSLKLVLVRLLRILNLAEISDGELVLNVDAKLVRGAAPYKVTKELVEELFNFCKQQKEHNTSSEMMYI
jgi:hypothetical protein